MTLIKSISGIRGTIGGATGDTLNPLDIVKFTTAYAQFIRCNGGNGRHADFNQNRPTIVVGRDARISGVMVDSVVCGTLMGTGFDVVNIGLATTPTTELAVKTLGADGGIIITASHNPRQWNALKLLNNEGEFLTAADGAQVLDIAAHEEFDYADIDHLGHYINCDEADDWHIENVLDLDLVDVKAVKKAHFKVCVDTINSVGGIILPKLFDKLGVEYTILNGEPSGDFAHNPEPLEKNLQGIMDEMKTGKYDLGIVVDPDVDRLAFICEDGKMFGEEYTLVSVADYVLGATAPEGGKKFATVSNLSSTRALRDVTEKHGGEYAAAAVGEVNVTTKMKEVGAVIGGEGNGGVIYPESHYGRDALVGIALFLTSLAGKGCKVSELRRQFPEYKMVKARIDLTPDTDVDALLEKVRKKYEGAGDGVKVNTIDGVKIDNPDSWVHLRKSNTEPIIRIYAEAKTEEQAQELVNKITSEIEAM